jgi:hypothetical protein
MADTYIKVSSEGLDTIANKIREKAGITDKLYFVSINDVPDEATNKNNFVDAIENYIKTTLDIEEEEQEIIEETTEETMVDNGGGE